MFTHQYLSFAGKHIHVRLVRSCQWTTVRHLCIDFTWSVINASYLFEIHTIKLTKVTTIWISHSYIWFHDLRQIYKSKILLKFDRKLMFCNVFRGENWHRAFKVLLRCWQPQPVVNSVRGIAMTKTSRKFEVLYSMLEDAVSHTFWFPQCSYVPASKQLYRHMLPYITDSVIRQCLVAMSVVGPLALLERFDLSTFLKTVHCDLMLSFTIDSNPRPLPCVKNFPTGNSRTTKEVGCLFMVFREYF